MHTARSSSRPGVVGVSTRHPREQAPLSPKQAPPRAGTPRPREQATPWQQAPPPDQAPLCGQTHACKHITLPQTSFAGGNEGLGTRVLF